MRRIAHISDLHFGAEDSVVAADLLDDLSRQRPDLVVVSGDLTQRARRGQFEAARAYLDQIAAPKVIVPGNHDLPLYDFVRRIVSPLGRYFRYINPELNPMFQDEEIAVVGVNTAPRALGRTAVFRLLRLLRSRCSFNPPGPIGSKHSSRTIRLFRRRVTLERHWWDGHAWHYECLRIAVAR